MQQRESRRRIRPRDRLYEEERKEGLPTPLKRQKENAFHVWFWYLSFHDPPLPSIHRHDKGYHYGWVECMGESSRIVSPFPALNSYLFL